MARLTKLCYGIVVCGSLYRLKTRVHRTTQNATGKLYGYSERNRIWSMMYSSIVCFVCRCRLASVSANTYPPSWLSYRSREREREKEYTSSSYILGCKRKICAILCVYVRREYRVDFMLVACGKLVSEFFWMRPRELVENSSTYPMIMYCVHLVNVVDQWWPFDSHFFIRAKDQYKYFGHIRTETNGKIF